MRQVIALVAVVSRVDGELVPEKFVHAAPLKAGHEDAAAGFARACRRNSNTPFCATPQ